MPEYDSGWREACRITLWEDREMLLPHVLESHQCGAKDVAFLMVDEAGWTRESYILAVMFDREDLLTEVGDGA